MPLNVITLSCTAKQIRLSLNHTHTYITVIYYNESHLEILQVSTIKKDKTVRKLHFPHYPYGDFCHFFVFVVEK